MGLIFKRVEVETDNQIAIKELQAKQLELLRAEELTEDEAIKLKEVQDNLAKCIELEKNESEARLNEKNARHVGRITGGDVLRTLTMAGLTFLGIFLKDYDPARGQRVDTVCNRFKI